MARPLDATALADASADLAAVAVQTDTTAFEQVSYRSDGFAIVPAYTAHSEDEITQAGVAAG